MTAEKVMVIGAGPAGLSFAYRYGNGAIVLEREKAAGGLCRSGELLDGVFDIGGHSFHTPHSNVYELVRELMGESWFEQSRDARVWVNGEIIPYPFQHHFEKLSDTDIVNSCRVHQADAQRVSNSANFEEWILERFGPGIAEHFMLPYNRKLWARDLKEMNYDWVGQRVATDRSPRLGERSQRRPLQSDSRVAYPAEGGFGAIFEALAKRCSQIEFGQDVQHIDLENRLIITKSGQTWPWREIVSTMPLPLLINSLSNYPLRLHKLASELKVVSLKVIVLLVRLHNRTVPQRIYVADPNVPPHKVAFNHTSSPNLAARLNHAVTCEVSYSDTKPAPPNEELVALTLDWMISCGIIAGPEDLVSFRVIDVPYGYPVNTHSKRAIVDELSAHLKTQGIHTIGRFGAWDYANSDECIRQGLSLAESLVRELAERA